METKLARISQLSKENPDMVFTSLGQEAGILGNSITEMKAKKCAYLHNANSTIILMLDINSFLLIP